MANASNHAGSGQNAPLDSQPINCERCGLRPSEIAPCPHCAQWLCTACLAMPCLEAPPAKSPTWTEHRFECQVCHRTTRASAEAIEIERKEKYTDGMTDAEIAKSFEFCIACTSGEHFDGEYVEASA